MKIINRLFLLVITSFGMFMLIPAEKSLAQILELDQKIFGMDCAPCAKGVENRMMRMNGIQKAVLDLNKGEASLTFAEQHTTSLQQIQKSIIDGGFSPKEARIKVRGILQQTGGEWQLTTESGDLFLFDNADANAFELNDGQKTTVEGTVFENTENDRWILKVVQLLPEG